MKENRRGSTAYKTVVLNAAPESAEGGPLALVQDGDMIRLDVAGRALELDVDRDPLDFGGDTAHRRCYHCTDDLIVLRWQSSEEISPNMVPAYE